MRSHRFFSAIPMTIGQELQLPKEVSHHCIQVLRYQISDELSLFNGDGKDYIAVVTAIDGKQCKVEIKESVALNNESPLAIHLFQGIARGEKMDLIIQKSVELGVAEVTPLFTERCNVKLEPKRLSKKLLHWQNVAVSACEQSGRAIVPQINSPINLKQLQKLPGAMSIYLEPTANQSITNIKLTPPCQINLFIGPEGGFSEQDLNLLKSTQVTGINLGPRILRTETAGFSCIAILQAIFGDL